MPKFIEEAPLKLINALRPFFQPRDRDYWPAEGRCVVLQAGLLANRPVTPIADGHAYYGTDTNTLYIGDGGAWVGV